MANTATANHPKRFVDRKDIRSIVKTAGSFSLRGHNNVSNLLFLFFMLLIVSFLVILLYLSTVILDSPGRHSTSVNIVTSLFLSFFVLVGYSVFLVARLKKKLNATEFVILSVSRTIENFSKAYCLLNKEGKVFYYNQAFFNDYMISNEVEGKDVTQLLSPVMFGTDGINIIKEALKTDSAAKLPVGKNMAQLEALPKPVGIFSLCIV